MNLLIALLCVPFSPGDSARALVNLRFIPEAAVLYAQIAAVEDGSWLVEYGRLLESSGEFSEAGRVYGLALGRSSSEESTRWLMNRRRGTAPLNVTLIIRVTIANTGTVTARDVQVILPEPRRHPPFQELQILESDFVPSMNLLSAELPCIAPGDTAELSLVLRISQQPGTMRPISGDISDDELRWLSQTIRGLQVPDALPGPCVPMCLEMVRLGRENGVDLLTTGGLILDEDSCVFHAWNEIRGTGIRIDPLLFRTDSLLAVAHSPSDVIPLWELDPTDGYELTLLYDSELYQLSGDMTARLK